MDRLKRFEPVSRAANYGIRGDEAGLKRLNLAQINGGQRAGAEEKGALKEWYIQNASFWLDIRIILRMGRERSDSKHA